MDQCICAAPHSFSQLITSFIASESLGIPHAPLIRLRDFYVFSLLLFQYVNELVAKSVFGNAGNISNKLLMPPSSMMEESRYDSSPERRCSSRTFRYGYLVTT